MDREHLAVLFTGAGRVPVSQSHASMPASGTGDWRSTQEALVAVSPAGETVSCDRAPALVLAAETARQNLGGQMSSFGSASSGR